MRCTSTSCTRQIFWATTTRSSWPSTTGAPSSGDCSSSGRATSSWRRWAAARCTRSNVRVGGFYAAPPPSAIANLADPLRRARDAALATVEWVAGFDFPISSVTTDSSPCEIRVAIHRTRPAGLLGRPRREPGELADLIVEEHVARSTALHARLGGRDPYLTGPLAATPSTRPPSAPRRRGGDEGRPGEVCSNPFRSIVVRAVELVFACNEALSLVEAYAPPDPPASDVIARPGTGTGATEAPRGLLLQSYEIDGEGIIRHARIVPPPRRTSSPSRRPSPGGPGSLDLSDDELGWRCEQCVRNHDPCISCAAHFLDITVVRA